MSRPAVLQAWWEVHQQVAIIKISPKISKEENFLKYKDTLQHDWYPNYLHCTPRMGSFECQSTCGIGLRLDSRYRKSYSREIISSKISSWRLSRSVFWQRTKTCLFYPWYLSIGTVDVSTWTSALLDWRLVLWVVWLTIIGFGYWLGFSTKMVIRVFFVIPVLGTSSISFAQDLLVWTLLAHTGVSSYRYDYAGNLFITSVWVLWQTIFYETRRAALFVKLYSHFKVCLSLRLRGGWWTVSRHRRVLG